MRTREREGRRSPTTGTERADHPRVPHGLHVYGQRAHESYVSRTTKLQPYGASKRRTSACTWKLSYQGKAGMWIFGPLGRDGLCQQPSVVQDGPGTVHRRPCEQAQGSPSWHLNLHRKVSCWRVGATRWCVKLDSNHKIISWIAEYAAVMLSRYEMGHDAMTGNERTRGKPSKIMGIESGRKLSFRRHPDRPKARQDGEPLGDWYLRRVALPVWRVHDRQEMTRTRLTLSSECHSRNAGGNDHINCIIGTPWCPMGTEGPDNELMPAVQIEMRGRRRARGHGGVSWVSRRHREEEPS